MDKETMKLMLISFWFDVLRISPIN